VATNLDTLLTALYVLIDDHIIESGPRRPDLDVVACGSLEPRDDHIRAEAVNL
jgi:hypothetical protein